jgi:hypothetical protein
MWENDPEQLGRSPLLALGTLFSAVLTGHISVSAFLAHHRSREVRLDAVDGPNYEIFAPPFCGFAGTCNNCRTTILCHDFLSQPKPQRRSRCLCDVMSLARRERSGRIQRVDVRSNSAARPPSGACTAASLRPTFSSPGDSGRFGPVRHGPVRRLANPAAATSIWAVNCVRDSQ